MENFNKRIDDLTRIRDSINNEISVIPISIHIIHDDIYDYPCEEEYLILFEKHKSVIILRKAVTDLDAHINYLKGLIK